MSRTGNGSAHADPRSSSVRGDRNGSGSGRIFWLGNHRLLINTELPRLRGLGFEVFHPPCRNTVAFHQSATTDWQAAPSTLPPDVYTALVATDFYYRSVPAEIFELLNRYFQTALVTIEASWLAELARGFRGRLLFRTYGHVHFASEQLWVLGAFRALTQHEDFWFLPHAEEQARQEHAWLRRRELVIPYCVDEAVAAAKDSWEPATDGREIMLSCPNIALNPGFAQHYAELLACFAHPSFRIYGLQTEPVDDPRVVGTIPFEQLISSYRRAAGFLYTYRDPGVCFLPPIEMMIIGGPVIFLEGSLLCRYMPRDAPGRARDLLEAREKCERLLRGDAEFARAVTDKQRAVRDRYLPSQVWPEFDAKLGTVLGVGSGTADLAPICWEPGARARRRIVALAHHAAASPSYADGRYTTDDPGVVRLLSLIRPLLLEMADLQLVVTCTADALPSWHGLLSQHLPDRAFLLHAVDATLPRVPPSPFVTPSRSRLLRDAERVTRFVPIELRSRLSKLARSGRERLRDWSRRVPVHIPAELLEGARVISVHPRCTVPLDGARLISLHTDQRDDVDLARCLLEDRA